MHIFRDDFPLIQNISSFKLPFHIECCLFSAVFPSFLSVFEVLLNEEIVSWSFFSVVQLFLSL